MMTVRPLQPTDRPAWQPLWDGYNAFYGRAGETALPAQVSDTAWERFLDPAEPMHALVAVDETGRLTGLVHYLFHRSTSRMEPVCYLQDLFTAPDARSRGVGRALIQAVHAAAQAAGAGRVYWHTQTTNTAGRALYDQVAQHLGFIVYSQEVSA